MHIVALRTQCELSIINTTLGVDQGVQVLLLDINLVPLATVRGLRLIVIMRPVVMVYL